MLLSLVYKDKTPFRLQYEKSIIINQLKSNKFSLFVKRYSGSFSTWIGQVDFAQTQQELVIELG